MFCRRAMVPFICDLVPLELRQENRLAVLEFLKTLSERNNLAQQDTLVHTWGLIGRTCGEQELVFTLLHLVEYLGHSHSLVAGLAYVELIQLAEDLDRSPLDLFKPFWRTVAINVVRDINSCPQKAQQLADLLGVSVPEFLLMTQTYTIPYLIQTKRGDVLAKIALARGADVRVQDLWLQPKENFAVVLATLLLQPSTDREQTAVEVLQTIVPGFSPTDLSSLVCVDPNPTACEILKIAAIDDEEGQKLEVMTMAAS